MIAFGLVLFALFLCAFYWFSNELNRRPPDCLIGAKLIFNGEFRTIVDYNPNTKIVTIADPFTTAPTPGALIEFGGLRISPHEFQPGEYLECNLCGKNAKHENHWL